MKKWWLPLVAFFASVILACYRVWFLFGFVLLTTIFTFITIWLWYEIRESCYVGPGKNKNRYVYGASSELAWFLAVILIMVSYCIIFGTKSILINTCSYPYNYILSSISQSLATLFALIFAVMFTIVQLSTEGANLSIYFTNVVLGYIFLFICAILLPLIFMGTEERLYVQMLVFLASVCLFMLIPFFWRFKIKASLIKTSSSLGGKKIKRNRKEM